MPQLHHSVRVGCLALLCSVVLVQGGRQFRQENRSASENSREEVDNHVAPWARGGAPKGKVQNHIAMLLSKGCSGSSFIWEVLKDLINMHGVHVWAPGKQMFHPDKEYFEAHRLVCTEKKTGIQHFWPRGDPLKTIEKAQMVLDGRIKCQEKILKGPTVFFMVGTPMAPDVYEGVLDFMWKQNASIAGMHRANLLDSHVCYSKDCFGPYGNHDYPVLFGKKSDLCFQRRKLNKSDAEGYKVNLDPNTLWNALDYAEIFYRRRGWKWMPLRKKYGLDLMKTSTFESLMAFEYTPGPKSASKSTAGFVTLLEGLGVPVDWNIVEQHVLKLQADIGLKKKKHHHEEIYNAKEVQRALKGTEFEWMWRGQ